MERKMRRGRITLGAWPPFLPTVRSLHWEDIHREAASHSVSPVYTPILSTPTAFTVRKRRGEDGPSKFSPWHYDGPDLGVLAWRKVSSNHWVHDESRCPPLCATPLHPPPQPLNLLPVPQLAHKADNELFIAAIHLHTSHRNCFSLWFSLWLCIPRKTAKQT